ncbi:MAG: secondary thiamine-phosphate synthase enzyme YjbQ [Anaerolineaceae bacterium]
MDWLKTSLQIETHGKGMYEITDPIQSVVREWSIQEGICFLFLQHTSASLITCEAYDPSARRDVEEFYERLAPERQSWYRHTLEGPDDSPSHIRTTLTQNSLTIPIDDGRLSLGTWQGIFLFEHRSTPHQRELLIRCLKAS